MSLILPHDDWPAADREMWAALRQQGGPFDDRGPLANLRETSMQTLANRYGRWLEWLRRTAPASLEEPPTARVTLPRLRDWLEALAHTAPMTQLMFVDGLLRVVSAAAPDADWARHRRIKAHLKNMAGRGNQARKVGRVLSSRVLLEAGIKLVTEGAHAATTPLQRAIRQRDGMLVAFLAMIPIRRRALVGLRIDHSLIVGAEVISLALPGELTKNGLPFDADIAAPVSGLLRDYLTATRPFLMERGAQHHDSLWVGDDGRPLSYAAIGSKIATITERLTGKRIRHTSFGTRRRRR